MVTYSVEPFFDFNKLWRVLQVLELDNPAIIRSRNVQYYNTIVQKVCKPLPLQEVVSYILSIAGSEDWIDVHTDNGVIRNVKSIAQLAR